MGCPPAAGRGRGRRRPRHRGRFPPPSPAARRRWRVERRLRRHRPRRGGRGAGRRDARHPPRGPPDPVLPRQPLGRRGRERDGHRERLRGGEGVGHDQGPGRLRIERRGVRGRRRRHRAARPRGHPLRRLQARERGHRARLLPRQRHRVDRVPALHRLRRRPRPGRHRLADLGHARGRPRRAVHAELLRHQPPPARGGRRSGVHRRQPRRLRRRHDAEPLRAVPERDRDRRRDHGRVPGAQISIDGPELPFPPRLDASAYDRRGRRARAATPLAEGVARTIDHLRRLDAAGRLELP